MNKKPGFRCDLCGVNQANLHVDEVIEGTLETTVHLCDECWYQLGIRIPLGNLSEHIQNLHQGQIPPELPGESRPDLIENIGESAPAGLDDMLNGLEDLDDSSIALGDPSTSFQGRFSQPGIGPIHPLLVRLYPFDLLVQNCAIPIELNGDLLTVAISSRATNEQRRDITQFGRQQGCRVMLVEHPESAIMGELRRHQPPETPSSC